MKHCLVKDCENRYFCKNYCRKHYVKWKKFDTPNPTQEQKGHRYKDYITPKCQMTDCVKPARSHGLCDKHAYRRDKNGSPDIVKKYREHHIAEQLFDTFTKESCWIMGWLATDGYISEDNGYISWSINDYEIADKIRLLFKNDLMPKKHKIHKSYLIKFNSVYLVKRCVELKLVQNKSLILEVSPIPNEQLSHYIRGVVEGDGHVSFRKDKRGYQYLRVEISSSSEKFVTKLKELIQYKGSISSWVPYTGNRHYQLVYCGKEAAKLCEWIYQDSEGLRLDRKYQEYHEYLKSISA